MPGQSRVPKIIGVGIRPGRIETRVEDIALQMGIGREELSRILERTGTRVLPRMAPSESPEELAADAAMMALNNANWKIKDIHGMFFSSSSPSRHYIVPGPARETASLIGLRNGNIITAGQGCGGGMDAFYLAYLQVLRDIQQGKIRTYLVISGDHASSKLDPTDKNTAFLLGDGFGAVIITSADVPNCYTIDDMASRTIYDYKYALIITKDSADARSFFYMTGPAVVKLVSLVGPAIPELFGLDRLPLDDVMIPHQPSLVGLQHLQKRTRIRVYSVIERWGNLVGASPFFALHDWVEHEVNDHPNKNLWLVAFGAEGRLTAGRLRPHGNIQKLVGKESPHRLH
ncbi:MAG: hypothetical protein HY537_09065 [Deltaproteobacteria bacterium]|nr:hypothetical protein [Deltaproteobacteria bacterium]